jgi:hypothetical protein
VFAKQEKDFPNPIPGQHVVLGDLDGVFSGICAQSVKDVDATYLLVESSIDGRYLLGNTRWHTQISDNLASDEVERLYDGLRLCLRSGFQTNEIHRVQQN